MLWSNKRLKRLTDDNTNQLKAIKRINWSLLKFIAWEILLGKALIGQLSGVSEQCFILKVVITYATFVNTHKLNN